jgi:hypothetical protein
MQLVWYNPGSKWPRRRWRGPGPGTVTLEVTMPPKPSIPMRPCPVCGTPFRPLPHDVQQGRGRCCSRACRAIGMTVPADTRFWSKVNQSDAVSCWAWQGALTDKGYAMFRVTSTRKVGAHRFAYESLVGPIPEGYELDHLCRNRACVNPAHLEPVLHRTNVLRGTGPTATNATLTHCRRGHLLAGSNVRIENGGRRCRVCQQERSRQYRLLRRR